MIATNIGYQLNIYFFMIPMFIVTFATDIIRPVANAGAMQLSAKSLAGSASAFFNFVSFACGPTASTYSLKFITTVAGFGVLFPFLD